MAKFENKVLRLFNSPNSNADWHSGNESYPREEVNSSEDSVNWSGKEITSIPSPFARIHLFENAFKWVISHAKRQGVQTLAEKTTYHQLVSDALDVAETFFNFNIFYKARKNLRIVRWNKLTELENLKSRAEHRLFGETLEFFLYQNNTETRFDQIDNFYLLFCDDVLLGGTSPSTLFFAANNEDFHLAKIRLIKDNDILFDDQPNPLYNRSMQLQRYLYGLFTVIPSLREVMKPLWQYMLVCQEVLKTERPNDALAIQNILDDQNFSYDIFKLDLVGEAWGEENYWVEVLSGIGHWHLDSYNIDYSNDDFAIKSDKYRSWHRPLALQNGFTKSLSYCGGKWNADIVVPFQELQQELDGRLLPGATVAYPYLTVSDFLEPNIIRVTYPLDEEHFFSGNLEGYRRSDRSKGDKGIPGEDSFLLPLTRRFFDFFDPDFLLSCTPDGTPHFRMIKSGEGGVEVTLLLPIQSGDFIVFKRTYLPERLPDIAKNEGAVVTCRFDIGFFPLFYIKDENEEKVQQIVVLADGDTLKETKHYEYHLDFVQRDGKAIRPDWRVRQDKHKHQQFVTTKYFSVNEKYDFIQVSNGEHEGVILPKWKVKSAGKKPVTVAVDFGMANSFVGFVFGDEEPCPLEITQKERFLVTLSEDWVNTNPPIMKEIILRTLLPYTFGENQECKLPIRTAVIEIEELNHNSSIPGVDISIPFFLGSRIIPKNEELTLNLKWPKYTYYNEIEFNRVISYLRMLVFMARNQIIIQGGDLNNCKLAWIYPSNIGEGRRAKINRIWERIASQHLGSNTKILMIPEALAPFYAYSAYEIKSRGYPVVNIDIGEDNTNMGIFMENIPKYVTSFPFAANSVFGNGFTDYKQRTNGFVRMFENKFLTWLEDNRGSIYNLTDAYLGESTGIRDKGSDEINRFFFSVENNSEVKNAKIRPWSYAKLLSEREDVKVVFLFFYSAIIYYLAQLMKHLDLPLPRQIAFSRGGAEIIKILDKHPSRRNTAGLARLIFERVYDQKYHTDGLDILVDSSPIGKTCYGAFNMLKQKLTNFEYEDAILMNIEKGTVLVEHLDKNTSQRLAYKDIANENVLEGIEKDVLCFIDLFFELDKNFSFSSKFGALSGEHLQQLQPIALRDIKHNLKTGLKISLEKFDGYDSVQEPLFFYPLIGAIEHLLDYIADEALVNENDDHQGKDLSNQAMPTMEIKKTPHLFICYSKEDVEYKEQLKKHLRLYVIKGLLTIWDDSAIDYGDKWKEKIEENLEKADIILVLLSKDFINSDFCINIELERALKRNEEGTAKVVPVFGKTCVWNGPAFTLGSESPFAHLQGTPRKSKFIDSFENIDKGWTEVAEAVGALIESFRNN